jgi:murein L,D-transpeptidase YcbB/YkuD
MKTIQKIIFMLIMMGSLGIAQQASQDLRHELLETEPHRLKNQSIIINFYETQSFKPLWLTDHGLKKEKIKQFLYYVRNDLTLHPRGFIFKEAERLSKLQNRNFSRKTAMQFELKLTALYYEFLQHTIYGEINWKKFNAHLKSLENSKIEANWVQYGRHFDVIKLMSKENVIQTIKEMTPKGYRYQNLLQALYKLYIIQSRGGWKPLPYFKSLKLGSRGIAVTKLRERLKISGDYKSCGTVESNLFDACLLKAVKRFQNRHSLSADGVVGKGTRWVLNKPVKEKINKVLLNIDRIKWLPRENSQRYIIVNIPEFLLHYVENQREVKTLKVIVGDTKHPTPIFSNKISYIVLNPYWKVPEGIVRREIVPHMIQNPNYIRKQGLQAHKTWEENSTIINLDNIVWEEYLQPDKRFPYRLMQPPGPRNALGKIKFKFPNRFSVYLHDTPTKRLFKRKRRAFSHGCVRLSNPRSLLQSIAKFDENVDLQKAQRILAGKKKVQLNVAHKIPIHIIYLTTGVNANNELIFRPDIYNYDKYQTRFIR